MMHKLIVYMQVTLIGLRKNSLASIIALALLGLMACSPEEAFQFNDRYLKNSTDSTVSYVRFLNRPSSIDSSIVVIPPQSIFDKGSFNLLDDDQYNGAETFAYKTAKVQLYVSDSLVKTWEGPGGAYGDSINSPFNYDSWVYEDDGITFTITEDDIVADE